MDTETRVKLEGVRENLSNVWLEVNLDKDHSMLIAYTEAIRKLGEAKVEVRNAVHELDRILE